MQWVPSLSGCDQAALRMVKSVYLSVCLSVCLSYLFNYVPIVLSWEFSGVITNDNSDVHAKVKVRGQRSRTQRSKPNLDVSGPYLQFDFTYDDEMIHNAWCCLGEVPYWFSRSSVKFEGHRAKTIVDFYPNWAFPDCKSSLNSPMALKRCTKLEVA